MKQSMDVNLKTPNSRMILDLLMKNAAKYTNETAVTEDVHRGEYVQKENCPLELGKENKKKKTKYGKQESKPLKRGKDLKTLEIGTKIKTEQFNGVKMEYTEVKTETDCDMTEASVKKEKSIILDILKNNVSKYEKTNIGIKKKRSNDSNDTREKNKRFKQDQTFHLELEDHNSKTDLPEEKHGCLKTEYVGNETIESKHPEIKQVENDNYGKSNEQQKVSRFKKKGFLFNHNQTTVDDSSTKKLRKMRTGVIKLKWSKEEDAYLLEAIAKFGDQINVQTLGEKLKRNVESVRSRVKSLKSGALTYGQYQPYTLLEDQLLIDAALKHLPDCALDQVKLTDSDGSEALIGRHVSSWSMRWDNYLKIWLMQHYSGTLNLDIRRMLANYIAENFQDVDHVDWADVARKPKFAGNTTVSLRCLFFNTLYRSTKKEMPDGSKVTPKDVADHTNAKFKEGNFK